MKINALLLATAGLMAAAWMGRTLFFKPQSVDFNTQIKPLINKHCISCHGGVKQAGHFSLLFRQEAVGTKGKSGKIGIVPGHAEHSEMIRRLTATDPDERMPKGKDALRPEEIDLLTQWVNQGADWGDHWAYQAPNMPSVPSKGLLAGVFSWGGWAKNDIDRFVEARLETEGISHADEADRPTLLRRVCLDLTGLPPQAPQFAASTKALFEQYLQSGSESAYEAVVTALLGSSAYGERWAAMWLDLARYADSRGYQKDNGRSIWKYRDWVIDAFNQDMPFDQFTKEQLAGDLLPNPNDKQLIATAFHRNTMNNDETGTVDEEFRVAALLDRVNTTWEVWQGTTFGCVQCHSHPYDPFRQEEYYKFMAFFNNTRDEDTQDEAPNLREFGQHDAAKLDSLKTWMQRVSTTHPNASDWLHFVRFMEPRFHAHYADNYVKGALLGDRLIGVFPNGSCRLPDLQLDGKTQLLMSYANKKPGGSFQLRLDSPTGPVLGTYRCDTTTGGKTELRYVALRPTAGRHDVYITAQNPQLKAEQEVFRISWFALLDDFPARTSPQAQVYWRQFNQLLEAKTTNTPIMLPNHANYQRPTKVFVRGNWLVHGAVVKPDVPKSFPSMKGLPANRLGLAEWIVSKQNPLTARVMANRIWEQLFGVGLVETLEDFGTQGAKPSHPELLDYLAVKFRDDYDWSLKKLVREIVLSATYRQDARAPKSLLQNDPQNRLLARGPRVRLTAEMIRDQALAASGLMSTNMYGKPVLPYQPEGVWQAVNSSLNYQQSVGEDNYRRAIYTFARRTGPYPSAVTFDAGSREVCLSRRIRTNTPLQALVLLNDPVFVEASVALAKSASKQARTPESQIEYAYRSVMGRAILPHKLKALTTLYAESLGAFKAKPASVGTYLHQKAPAQLAALSVVANSILNLDEVVVK